MSDIFSPANLSKAIHATLEDAYAAIPEGKSHAVIFDGTWTTDDGPVVRALFVQRAPDGWTVVLEGAYERAPGVAGKVAVAKSW